MIRKIESLLMLGVLWGCNQAPLREVRPQGDGGIGREASVPEAGDANVPIDHEGWKLVWSDEFDGPSGQAPDPSRWTPEVGVDWGNNQLEYDTDRPVNAALDGQGHLAIVARRERYTLNNKTRNFTSARLVTRGHFEKTYGRFEARIKLPTGQGMWPAFWLLGANFSQVAWPNCGEIDIMENKGQEPAIVRGSLHGPGYFAGTNVGHDTSVSGGNLSEIFHRYAVEWDPEKIVWFVDDTAYFTATPASLPPAGRWVYDHPFFMILNVAVGGDYVGDPNTSTQFPQTMFVDYVRVYERAR